MFYLTITLLHNVVFYILDRRSKRDVQLKSVFESEV